MEIWQIILICILMLPAFHIINYRYVTGKAKSMKEREEKIENAVASSVARSFTSKGIERYESWTKYNHKRGR
jgi:UTP:GlnB (protein PII) uridylyltransferase